MKTILLRDDAVDSLKLEGLRLDHRGSIHGPEFSQPLAMLYRKDSKSAYIIIDIDDDNGGGGGDGTTNNPSQRSTLLVLRHAVPPSGNAGPLQPPAVTYPQPEVIAPP